MMSRQVPGCGAGPESRYKLLQLKSDVLKEHKLRQLSPDTHKVFLSHAR